MGILALLRNRRSAALSLLLALWVASPISGLLRAAWTASHRETEVEAARIRAGGAAERCHHHPEGCPRECLCPKIQDSPGEETPGVRETAWVQCNEGKAMGEPPAFAVLAGFPAGISWSLPAHGVHPDGLPISAPRDPFLDPLRKVPRDRA